MKKHKYHDFNVYSVDLDPKELLTEIFRISPVKVGFSVYTDFLTYKLGVYKLTPGKPLEGSFYCQSVYSRFNYLCFSVTDVQILDWDVEDSKPYRFAAKYE